MKFILVQENPIVGDIEGNAQKVIDIVAKLNTGKTNNQKNSREKKETLAVFFSELFLVGYPPKDLLCDATFIEKARKKIEQITEQIPSHIHVFLGCIAEKDRALTHKTFDGTKNSIHNALYNSVYYLNDKKIKKNHSQKKTPPL